MEPSAALTILGTGLGLTPLILAGTPEQQEKFLKPFLSGESEPLASFVHSEPTGTANWLKKGAPGLQTTAYKDGDDWVVDGEKVCGMNRLPSMSHLSTWHTFNHHSALVVWLVFLGSNLWTFSLQDLTRIGYLSGSNLLMWPSSYGRRIVAAGTNTVQSCNASYAGNRNPRNLKTPTSIQHRTS